MSWPSATGLRSTSIGAPAAMVDASGFIWEIKGQSAAAPPTAAAAPVATNKKSRRVGWSAEDAVVTIPTLSSYAAGGPLREPPRSPEQPAGARGPPRRQNFACPHQNKAKTAVQNRSIGTLAGRAQARYRRGSVQCTNSAASDVLLRHFRPAPNPIEPMQ